MDAETGVERLYLGGDAYSAASVYVKEAGSWNIYYICRDYQGSITHIVNANGTLKQELSYDPWGRLRDPNTQQVYAVGAEPTLFLTRGYTGHEHLSVFGLINMNARLYDPALGRFLSPDSYVQSPDNSQNFNRYSYCLNNPLRYSDPSGLITWSDVVAGVSLVAGIVLEFVPGGQGIGSALIGAGFSHFALTINAMQNNKNLSWNDASNGYGYTFNSGPIPINGPTAKEKNYSNSSLNNQNISNTGSDKNNNPDANVLDKNMNVTNDIQNGLYIRYGTYMNSGGLGGAQMEVRYTGLEDMSNAYWKQYITTNVPFPGREYSFLSVRNGNMTSYWDDSHSGNGRYYSENEMRSAISPGGYTVSFGDTPSRYVPTRPFTTWNANLYLINNGNPILRINYGFTIDCVGPHALPYTYYFYPQQ